MKAQLRCKNLILGNDCEIDWTARIMNGGPIYLGNDTVVRTGAILQPTSGFIKIGESCSVGAYSVLDGTGGLTIGDLVRMGPHVCVYSANHNFDDCSIPIADQGLNHAPVTISEDVWIGAGCIILAGVTIGQGSVIAAGSVVTRDTPAFSVSAGVPAKIIKFRNHVQASTAPALAVIGETT